jgi:tetratricopeptide (TPR) repeat protein
VAEELEEAGPQAGGGEADPAAMALALGGASRAKADAFLDDQRGLIAEQRHHMHEQLRHLGAKLWELRLGVLLRIATAFIGIAVAAALAWLVWDAAVSNDLVIDAFAVPPDLAAQGLSGPVVAAKLSDKIAAMQAGTISARAPKSYANGLSDGLKLAIPETGVSLFELDRFLRQKLGHDQHIGGEMVQSANGIALTARVGADGSATVTGAEADMDTLLQKLAEQIYRSTQPYRYGVWLQLQGRNEEAVAVFKTLAAAGPPSERAWAYNGWAVNTLQRESERAGQALLRRGFALDPDHFLIANNIASSERRLGREEQSSRDFHTALTLLKAHGRDYTTPDRIASGEHNNMAVSFWHQGALLEALEENRLSMAAAGGANVYGALSFRSEILAALHEPMAARAALAERPQIYQGANQLPIGVPSLAIALEEQDWPATLAAEREFDLAATTLPGIAEDRPTMAGPGIALALAHLGRFAQAEGRLKSMPADCYPCLIARADVAAMREQAERADWWFARAVATAPTAPFAEAAWGRALLARKQPDAAIAHFAAANRIGPHFADPLEGWGEALMAKNESRLAPAKFAEAEKHAPNWGWLQLKWGEALAYAGKKDEAAKHFARAATLDLTPAEKSELAERTHG